MKRIVSMLIAVLMIVNSALAYTRTVRALGIGMVITSEKGTEVTLTPTNEEIKGWEVEEGDIEIVNNQFTMPEGNVKIKATEEEKYLFKLIFPYFTKEENISVGEPMSVQALTENEEFIFESWTATGITLTEEQKVSPTISFTMPANAVTLVANYEEVVAPTYTVTYNANGGTGTMSSQTFTQGVAQNLTANTFTKDGYTFTGWATTSSGSVEYGDGASYTATADTTLYAVWRTNEVPTLATYAGTWYTQGGTTIEKSSITSIALLDNYTPTGTVVESWDASKNSTGTITAYVEDDGSGNSTYKLTLAGNGAGIIMADTRCNSTFYGFTSVTSISGLDILDTSNVITMVSMFKDCDALTSVDVSGFDTSKVTDIGTMFYGCSSLTSIDVSGFDTGEVTDMSYMFHSCSSLTSVDVSGFDTSKVTDMMAMFYECSSLRSIDVSGFNTIAVTNMAFMFKHCKALTSIDVSRFDTGEVTDMSYMFQNCSSLTNLDVSGFDTSKVTDIGTMFYGCSSLTSIDVSGFDTGEVTDMSYMFQNCSSLTNVDVSGFNTSNVTNMGYMFNVCSSLTSIDVSGFDTSNVTDMENMFSNCSGLTSIDVDGFDTGEVTDMSYMFYSCSSLTSIDVSGFDTSKVTTMTYMFYSCSSLTSIDVGSFDTSSVKSMFGMFSGCRALTNLDVSGFNTGNVITMENMFYSCSSLTSIDVSGFDTSKVTNTRYMFYRCSSLTSVDVSGFDTSKITNMVWMFYGMDKLQEITLGANFSFVGNGTATDCVLPTPSSTYITGADGNWYNSAGAAFAPADVPNNVADTYYATSSLVPDPWNEPTLGEGLTPVNWNGTTWVTTDEANWDYNYEIATAGHNTVAGDGTGKWANAQTADGSLYVWIPRYTYKITSGEHASGNSWSSVDSPGTNKIEVKFSKGTTDDTTDSYKKHPAFTFGTDELEGIWVAKYEASRNDATSSSAGSGTTVTSKPGVQSWRNISVSKMYDYSYNLNRTLDSHLMKNSEWGAVAYLTNAVGKIPYINDNSNYITGIAGSSQDDNSTTTSTTNAWNTVNGVKASSTHNVYGIYDLSGGSWEYVSAYYTDGDSTYLSADTSSKSYAGSLYTNRNTKYVDTYSTAYDSSKTGDAVYETSSSSSGTTSWDGDFSNAPYSFYPVFWRGGGYSDVSYAGVFFFAFDNGVANSFVGFRPVLAIP